MSSDSAGSTPKADSAASDTATSESGNEPKPPPDSSWLKTEEIRGDGWEQLPVALEDRDGERSSQTREPE